MIGCGGAYPLRTLEKSVTHTQKLNQYILSFFVFRFAKVYTTETYGRDTRKNENMNATDESNSTNVDTQFTGIKLLKLKKFS